MTHHIEEAVRVYLRADLATSTWVVDGATVDGEPLYSEYDNGPLNEACECDDLDECQGAVDQMVPVDMPTGEELMHLLAKALGYRVVKGA